jgi:hypothetical protein
MVLFWITSVFGLELGVQPPLGLVLLDDELLPQAIITAIAAATITPVNTRIVSPLNPRTLEP